MNQLETLMVELIKEGIWLIDTVTTEPSKIQKISEKLYSDNVYLTGIFHSSMELDEVSKEFSDFCKEFMYR